MKKYKGVKTTEYSNGKEKVYYEQAFDRFGKGLHIGDRVKVVSIENNPEYTLGKTFSVCGIFEGDLMLNGFDNSMFYCWPRNVVVV